MTAKPETAAEVLAGKRKEFEESEWLEIEAKAEVLCERYRMRKRAGGNVASFRDFLPYWAAVAAVERALSAQGTPIGWGEIDHGRLVSFTASRTERNTAPLYTHPAPARVTDRPEPYVATSPYVDRIIRIFSNHSLDDTTALVLKDYARAALTAALEAYLPRGCEHSDEFNSAVSKALEADHG